MLAYKSTDGFIYIGQNNVKKEKVDKTLLNLTIPDMYALIKSSDTWFSSLSGCLYGDSDFIFSKMNNQLSATFNVLDRKYNPNYVITDIVHIDSDTHENNADESLNVEKTSNSDVFSKKNIVDANEHLKDVVDNTPKGTSKLVYSPSRGTVKIAKRTSKPKDKCSSEYSVCISDDIREDFFRDVRRSVGFSKFSKWEISDMYDPKLFSKWREIMRNSDGLKRG